MSNERRESEVRSWKSEEGLSPLSSNSNILIFNISSLFCLLPFFLLASDFLLLFLNRTLRKWRQGLLFCPVPVINFLLYRFVSKAGSESSLSVLKGSSVAASPHHLAKTNPPWISGFSSFFGVKKLELIKRLNVPVNVGFAIGFGLLVIGLLDFS